MKNMRGGEDEAMGDAPGGGGAEVTHWKWKVGDNGSRSTGSLARLSSLSLSILTDSALLELQKFEIEELRKKLQGSRAEALEQEILKLRSEMFLMQVIHQSCSNDQMDLKTMVDAIVVARKREAETHQRAFILSEENDEVQLKLRACTKENNTLLAELKEATEDKNSIIQMYEHAACASKSRDMSTCEKDEMSDMEVELPEIAESEEIEMKLAVENLEHELQDMLEENEKLTVLYEEAMLERDAYKKMLSSTERSRTEAREQRGCGEKLIIDEGKHNEFCSGYGASTSNEQRQQHPQPLQYPRC